MEIMNLQKKTYDCKRFKDIDMVQYLTFVACSTSDITCLDTVETGFGASAAGFLGGLGGGCRVWFSNLRTI